MGMRPPGGTLKKLPTAQPQPAGTSSSSAQPDPIGDKSASPPDLANVSPPDDQGDPDTGAEGPDGDQSPRAPAHALHHGVNKHHRMLRRAGSRGDAAGRAVDNSRSGQDHGPAAEVQCNGSTRTSVPPGTASHAAPSLAAGSSTVPPLPLPAQVPLSPRPALAGGAGVLQQDVQPLLLQDGLEAMRWCLEKDRHYHKVRGAACISPCGVTVQFVRSCPCMTAHVGQQRWRPENGLAVPQVVEQCALPHIST